MWKTRLKKYNSTILHLSKCDDDDDDNNIYYIYSRLNWVFIKIKIYLNTLHGLWTNIISSCTCIICTTRHNVNSNNGTQRISFRRVHRDKTYRYTACASQNKYAYVF